MGRGGGQYRFACNNSAGGCSNNDKNAPVSRCAGNKCDKKKVRRVPKQIRVSGEDRCAAGVFGQMVDRY